MKVPLCSTGLRLLRGHCSASSHSDLQPCNAGQRVLLTTDCPWPTSYRLKTGQEGEILPKQGLLWPVGPERAHFWFFDITLFFKRPYPRRIKSAHSFPITRPYISYPITRPYMMNTALASQDLTVYTLKFSLFLLHALPPRTPFDVRSPEQTPTRTRMPKND